MSIWRSLPIKARTKVNNPYTSFWVHYWISSVQARIREFSSERGRGSSLFETRGPNGHAHILHLSTMCHLFGGSARAANFVYWSVWEKHKLGRGRWDFASCQVSLNSVQRYQRRSRKCLSQSEAWRQLCFSDRTETANWYRTLRSCFLTILLNSIQWVQMINRNYLSQSEAGAAILFFLSALQHKLGIRRRRCDLASCQLSFSGFRGEVENVSANQRPGKPSWFFFFSIVSKNTNLLKDIKILLPVKFHWIYFSDFQRRSW